MARSSHPLQSTLAGDGLHVLGELRPLPRGLVVAPEGFLDLLLGDGFAFLRARLLTKSTLGALRLHLRPCFSHELLCHDPPPFTSSTAPSSAPSTSHRLPSHACPCWLG